MRTYLSQRRMQTTREQQEFLWRMLATIQGELERRIYNEKEPKEHAKLQNEINALERQRFDFNEKMDKELRELKKPIEEFKRKKESAIRELHEQFSRYESSIREAILFYKPADALATVKAIAKKHKIKLTNDEE